MFFILYASIIIIIILNNYVFMVLSIEICFDMHAIIHTHTHYDTDYSYIILKITIIK
jgi:hypothetical protein